MKILKVSMRSVRRRLRSIEKMLSWRSLSSYGTWRRPLTSRVAGRWANITIVSGRYCFSCRSWRLSTLPTWQVEWACGAIARMMTKTHMGARYTKLGFTAMADQQLTNISKPECLWTSDDSSKQPCTNSPDVKTLLPPNIHNIIQNSRHFHNLGSLGRRLSSYLFLIAA